MQRLSNFYPNFKQWSAYFVVNEQSSTAINIVGNDSINGSLNKSVQQLGEIDSIPFNIWTAVHVQPAKSLNQLYKKRTSISRTQKNLKNKALLGSLRRLKVKRMLTMIHLKLCFSLILTFLFSLFFSFLRFPWFLSLIVFNIWGS